MLDKNVPVRSPLHKVPPVSQELTSTIYSKLLEVVLVQCVPQHDTACIMFWEPKAFIPLGSVRLTKSRKLDTFPKVTDFSGQ